jgi:hypothetical protein
VWVVAFTNNFPLLGGGKSYLCYSNFLIVRFLSKQLHALVTKYGGYGRSVGTDDFMAIHL